MAAGYKIRSHDTLGGTRLLVLMPEDDELDFLESLEAKPKQRERVRLIKLTLERLSARGIAASIKGRQIRILEGSIGLAEVAVAGRAIRVMCYIHNLEMDPLPVLLFDFDGHQGSNKIPESLMEKGRKLAEAARLCMGEE